MRRTQNSPSVAAAALVLAVSTGLACKSDKKPEGPSSRASLVEHREAPADPAKVAVAEPATPSTVDPIGELDGEILTENLNEAGCMSLVSKWHRFAPEVRTDQMDAEILGHCDGYSGESDLVIQSCLHAAKDAASMEECIVGDNESDDLDSPPG